MAVSPLVAFELGAFGAEVSKSGDGGMRELLAVLVIATAIGIGAIALTVLSRVLATRLTAKAGALVSKHPYRSFGIGLLNLLFVVALLSALEGAKAVEWIPAVFIAALAVMLWLGSGAACGAVGSKLLRLLGKDVKDPVRSTALGAVLLCLSLGLPFLGWAVAAAVALAGLGAVWGAFFVKKPAAEGKPDPAP